MSIRGRIRGKTGDIFWAEMGYDMKIKTDEKYHIWGNEHPEIPVILV
jgi:hypothetical protein